MNHSVFYATSIVFSCTALFLLWQLGIRPLLLDNFRDDIFEVRDQLYRLAQEEKISCNSPAYRAVELFLNSVIRYAHRFTFLTLLLSHVAMQEPEAKAVAVSAVDDLNSKIAGVTDPAVQQALKSMVTKVTFLLPRYIAKSSLAFICSSVIYYIFRSSSPLIARAKQTAVSTFESEAFRAAESETYAKA